MAGRGALLGVVGLTLGGCASGTLHQTLREDYGYTPLQPADNRIVPGMILRSSRRQPEEVTIVCGAQTVMGPEVGTWVVTTPSSGKMPRELGKQAFRVDADFLAGVQAGLGLEGDFDVTLNLSDVTLSGLPLDRALEGLRNISEACADMVRLSSAEGYEVFLVTDVLRADIDYHVTQSGAAGVEAQLPPELLKGLAVGLGLTVERTAGEGMTETQLTWAYRRDTTLLTVLGMARDVEEPVEPEVVRIVGGVIVE